MRKIILFSIFLIIGLIGSQTIPTYMSPDAFEYLKSFFDAMLYICLAFIMINVGREFELDKSKWKSYTEDYFIAMATAASFADSNIKAYKSSSTPSKRKVKELSDCV